MKFRPAISRAARMCAAGATITAAATAAAVDQPNPGLYEVTTRMVYGDLSVPPVSITTKQCLTLEALQESLSQALTSIPMAQNCETVEFDVASGSIAMQLRCAVPEGSITMETTGSYTESDYAMQTTIVITGGDSVMNISGDISGKRIGDC